MCSAGGETGPGVAGHGVPLQPAPPQRRHLARPLRGRDRRQSGYPHAGLPNPGADAPGQSLLPLPGAGGTSSRKRPPKLTEDRLFDPRDHCGKPDRRSVLFRTGTRRRTPVLGVARARRRPTLPEHGLPPRAAAWSDLPTSAGVAWSSAPAATAGGVVGRGATARWRPHPVRPGSRGPGYAWRGFRMSNQPGNAVITSEKLWIEPRHRTVFAGVASVHPQPGRQSSYVRRSSQLLPELPCLILRVETPAVHDQP